MPQPHSNGGDARGRSPFTVLETSFKLLTTGPRPLALPGSEVDGLPARPIPLGELRARLLHPATPYHTRDEAIGALLRRAQADGGAWLVGLAGVLLPGLRGALAPLAEHHIDKLWDLEAEMLTGFLSAAGRLSPGQPRLAASLVWSARRAAQRALDAEAAERGRPQRSPLPAAPPRPWGHPDLVLAQAAKGGVLSREDAGLVAATRLEGVRLGDAARSLGASPEAAGQRRWRAERALASWLRAGGSSEPSPRRRPAFLRGGVPTSPAERLLASAVVSGAVSDLGAELVFLTRWSGLPLVEAARAVRRSYSVAWRVRSQAERDLSGWVRVLCQVGAENPRFMRCGSFAAAGAPATESPPCALPPTRKEVRPKKGPEGRPPRGPRQYQHAKGGSEWDAQDGEGRWS
ncbi:MAG TPA: hypothetical protein VED59_08395 [Acidimicrobiales bacterium]|nr:hypothetical protein [Acidimicrobiales bacterium]